MENLKKELYKVVDKESFILFTELLSKHENNNTFIENIGNYTEDIDGFYMNLNNENFNQYMKEIKESYNDVNPEKVFSNLHPMTWRIFADILFGSLIYE